MTKEEKKLLFVDLCGRLPYGVKCKVWLKDKTTEEGVLDISHNYGDVLLDFFFYRKIEDLKPYLRPMSSMTEEEVKEFYDVEYIDAKVGYIKPTWNWHFTINGIDWLNSHHFDYRGLIEKGLALEAPKDMYNNKTK